MTAEVGVMNRIGVALAADSAVSIGPAAEKIYTSADKLFHLSESAPVGVMIYGNANFVGVPWETILKIYRRNLGSQTFETLKEYSQHLANFLENHVSLFPEEAQESCVTQTILDICNRLLAQFRESFEARHGNKKKFTVEEVETDFKSFIKRVAAEVTQFPDLAELPDDFKSQVKTRYQDLVNRIKDSVFEQIPRTEVDEPLTDLIIELTIKDRDSEGQSGLVIAGFGEQEHFPAMVTLKLYGMAMGQLLFSHQGTASVTNDNQAIIAPFAQREMVQTFMEGIDPALRRMIERSTQQLFTGMTDKIIKKVGEKYPAYGKTIEGELKQELQDLVESLIEQWKEAQNVHFTSPIIRIVGALPKDELAAMAESLVNLTKFKRRVSWQQETVGGPIDVAIITKGDGFIWVKRKHYFRPELNPRFMNRFSKGGV